MTIYTKTDDTTIDYGNLDNRCFVVVDGCCTGFGALILSSKPHLDDVLAHYGRSAQ